MRSFRLSVLLFALAATAGAQETATTIVPVVGSVRGPGMVEWKTDVEVINDTAFETDVALELASAPNAPAIIMTLAPGQVQRFTDIAGQAFGLTSVLSPLRITTAGRRPVSVRATAYAIRADGISPAQPVAIYNADTYYPLRILDGLAFSDAYRTNIGLMNFGERGADFVLALQRLPGRNLAVVHVHVPPGSLIHTSIQSIFPLITEGEGFSVVVETPFRETYTYASVIRSEDHAGTFIPQRVGVR